MTQDSPKDSFETIPVSDSEPQEPTPSAEETIRPSKPAFPRKRKNLSPSRVKLVGLLLIALAILYLAGGRFLGSFLFQNVLPDRLARHLDRPVTIGSAEFDPLSMSLTLKNGIIGPKPGKPDEGKGPLLSFSTLRLDMETVSLLQSGLICQQVDLDQLYLHIVRNSDASYNIAKLFGNGTRDNREESRQSARSGYLEWIPYDFSFSNITLTNSRLQFDDQQAGRTHTIEDITLALPVLSNLPLEKGHSQTPLRMHQYIHPKFSAKINGSPIDLSGETKMTADTFEARLAVDLKEVDLPNYLAYLPKQFPLPITQGTADLDLNLIFASGPEPEPRLQIKGVCEFSDVRLNNAAGPVTQIPAAMVDVSLMPLTRRFHFPKITMKNPELHLERTPSGRLIFPGSASKPATPAGKNKRQQENEGKATTAASYTIAHLQITDAKLSFIDQSVKGGFSETLSGVNLTLESLGPGTSGAGSFDFSCANPNGTKIVSKGKISLAPFQAEGSITLDKLKLPKLSPYLQSGSALLIQSGSTPKIKTRFKIAAAKENKKIYLALSGLDMDIRDLKLAAADRKWLELPMMNIKDASFSTQGKNINFGQITAQSPYIYAYKNKQGILNWLSETPEADKTDTTQKKGWAFDLKSLQVDHGTLEYNDHTFAAPLQLSMKDIDIVTGDAPADKDRKLSVTASAGLNGGKIHIEGPVTPSPFDSLLNCRLKDVPLSGLTPLFSKWFSPHVTDGILQANGAVSLPHFSFTGTAGINNFAAANSAGYILGWQQAVGRKLAFNLTPFNLKIDTISLDRPFLGWTLSKNGKSSISEMFKPIKKTSALGKGGIDIQEINLSAGTLAFVDKTVEPDYLTEISSISGVISGLRNQQKNRTRFALQGMVDEAAPVNLDAQFGFFDKHLFVDSNSQVTGLSLPPLSRYLEPHLGYTVEAGKLTMNTRYHLENKTITADNSLQLADFRLGKLLVPDSHLPLTLALLMDPSGLIKMDIPVRGTTGDPAFSFQGALTKMLRNLLLKTAVSPFKLLYTFMPKLKKTDLPDHIIFPLGESELTAGGRLQLSALVEALQNRPWLKLKVKGFTAESDREALLAKIQQEAARQLLERETRLSTELSSGYGKEEIAIPDHTTPQMGNGQDIPLPDTLSVKSGTLSALAKQRSSFIYNHLISLGIPSDQLTLEKTGAVVPESSPGRPGNRVDFALDTLLK